MGDYWGRKFLPLHSLTLARAAAPASRRALIIQNRQSRQHTQSIPISFYVYIISTTMKTSSTALLATMAAASTHASKVATTSSGSERRLSGKSGKSAKALDLGLASPEDYQWVLGNYKAYDATLLALINGESGADYPFPEGAGLEISFLSLPGLPPGLSLQAKLSFSFVNEQGGQVVAREIYDGVASYNADFTNQVTFYSDHLEFQLPDGSWAPLSDEEASDVGSITCSKLPKVPSGSSIVCDSYSNDYLNIPDVGTFTQEVIASAVWTDITTTDED